MLCDTIENGQVEQATVGESCLALARLSGPAGQLEKNTLRIFVGNLPFSINEGDLTALFEPFGEVQSIQIMTDRDTGKPRGFGFVEMSSDDGQKAIAALNGKDVQGRAINVNEARPKVDRGGGGGFSPGGGGFGDRRGRGGRGGHRGGGRPPREPRW
ncbi:MAG: RNA-binding protein [Acidobacteria bacterium]|nr:RNA-binding protein [Acidobacteriota bacterium]